jgi:hypothetical protein
MPPPESAGLILSVPSLLPFLPSGKEGKHLKKPAAKAVNVTTK